MSPRDVTVTARLAGRRRQEQRDRDDDLAVAPLQRADHPHGDQRHQLRARRQQQLRVWRRCRLRQRAADRRRRHARPERRHGLDLLQLQHRRGIPVPGPRRAGGIRRLHRRGRQHDHQVGRQPLSAGCSTSSVTNTEPRQQQRAGRRRRGEPDARRSGQVDQKYGTSRRSSADRSSRTSCSSSRARSGSCSRPIRPAASPRRHEVSPRLNLKLTWQPNRTTTTSRATSSTTRTTSSAAPGVSALIANDDLTNQEDAPEYVWMTQYRHLFSANTFARSSTPAGGASST